jgi:hypothetical protein
MRSGRRPEEPHRDDLTYAAIETLGHAVWYALAGRYVRTELSQ